MIRPRRVVRAGLLGLLLIVVALAAWGARDALAARSALEQVRADLVHLRDDPPPRAELAARLDADARRAGHAAGLMRHAGARMLARIPLAGHSVEAERRVADAAGAAVVAAADLDRATSGLGSAGQVDLDTLARAAQALQSRAAALRGPIDRLRTAPTSWEPGSVRRAVFAAQAQLGTLDDQLARAAAASRALHGVLGGSGLRHVLVVLQNNAELRGTGGLVSTFATGTAQGGRLQLDPFRDVRQVLADPRHAVAVPAPPDYVAHYGVYRANTTLWRNVTMTPDVPTAAKVLAEVAGRTLGTTPDVVLLLDVPGIARITDATAPVSYAGKRLSGEALQRALLVDAYAGIGPGDAAQTARRRGEEQAADAALRDLAHAPASLSFAKALAQGVAGRHIALWSARPDEQADLAAAGAAGSVDPHGDDVALAVADNLGDSPGNGNKLDVYVQRSVSLDVRVHARSVEVSETLTLANRVPAGLSPYAAGVQHPGRVLELVQLGFAAGARIESFTSGGSAVPAGQWEEDGSRRVVFVAELPRGQTGTWTLRYEVPGTDRGYALRLIPQPLATAARLHLGVHVDPGVGVDVRGPHGDEATWDAAQRLTVTPRRPGWWSRLTSRVRRFWDEPVRL